MDTLKTPEVRKVCHDIRGCMQGLRLCLSALETPMTTDERVEFVQDIISATDRMTSLMDKLDEAVDHAEHAPFPTV